MPIKLELPGADFSDYQVWQEVNFRFPRPALYWRFWSWVRRGFRHEPRPCPFVVTAVDRTSGIVYLSTHAEVEEVYHAQVAQCDPAQK